MKNDRLDIHAMLVSLEPMWNSDPLRGRQLFEAAVGRRNGVEQKRGRNWRWIGAGAAATACMCLATLSIPEARAIAQDLWDRLTLSRVDVVRLELSKLPLRLHVTMSLTEEPVADAGEAERKAGFRPYLPPWAVTGADPELTVDGPAVVEQTISVHDLESALREAGASDVQVPTSWDGVTLRAEFGSMVKAKYPDGVEILEIQPVQLRVPAGFPLERFAEAAFRSIGVDWREARRMAREFVAHPAWFFDIPPNQAASVREVMLGSGPAMLIENLDDRGAVERVSVFRSTPDLIFAVSGGMREDVMKIAEALP